MITTQDVTTDMDSVLDDLVGHPFQEFLSGVCSAPIVEEILDNWYEYKRLADINRIGVARVTFQLRSRVHAAGVVLEKCWATKMVHTRARAHTRLHTCHTHTHTQSAQGLL